MSLFSRRMQRSGVTPAAPPPPPPPPPPANGVKVAMYYPGWARSSSGAGQTSIANLNWNSFTHLIDFSLDLSGGQLSAGSNGWNTADANTICTEASARGKKALVCIGGAGTASSWNSSLSTASQRTQIVTQICNYMSTYGYNGVDLDGEPGTSITNYRVFWQEILGAFASKGWRTPGSASYRTVTMALAGEEVTLAKNAIADGCDWVAPMLYCPYENTSRHLSPLSGAGYPWDSTISSFTTGTNAIPPEKVMPGMSFYTFSWAGVSGPNVSASSYSSDQDWSVVNSSIGGINAPNATWYSTAAMHGMTISGDWYSFESARSIQAKADWIATNNCAGVIVWMYQHGSLGGSNNPLAGAMQTSFGPLM